MQDRPWGHQCHGCPRECWCPNLAFGSVHCRRGWRSTGVHSAARSSPPTAGVGKTCSLPALQQPHQGKGWPWDRAGTSPQQGREAGAGAGRGWGAGRGSSHTQHLKEGQLPPQSGSQDPRSPAVKQPAAAGKERSTHPASSWVCPQLLLRRGRPR